MKRKLQGFSEKGGGCRGRPSALVLVDASPDSHRSNNPGKRRSKLGGYNLLDIRFHFHYHQETRVGRAYVILDVTVRGENIHLPRLITWRKISTLVLVWAVVSSSGASLSRRLAPIVC